MVGKRSQPDRERDPVAELARLIAHADTHEESAPSDHRFRLETGSEGYEDTPELPPAPQLAADLNEPEQTCERDEHCADDQPQDVDDELYAAEGKYQDNETPYYAGHELRDSESPYCPTEEEYQDNEPGRRRSLTLVMAIFGLALVGSACAVGYRNMFAGSVSPTLPPSVKAINERNTIPSVSDPRAESSGNTREIGPATTGSIDNMVSPENQPAAVGPSKAAQRASQPRASAPAMPAAS
jgi:hypothetical protein